MPLRVLLAVHSRYLREVLTHFITSDAELDLVAEAGDSDTAFAELSRSQPDVAVLDVCLLGYSGLCTLRMARKQQPNTRLVILGDDDHDEYRRAARAAGASAFLLKTQAFPLLRPTIKHLATPQWAGNAI